MTISEKHKAEARDLSFTGCGCDYDATEDCVNWNGERCAYAETRIAAALSAAEARGIVKGLTEAREIIAEHEEAIKLLTLRRFIQKRSEGNQVGLAYVQAIDARLSVLKAQGEGK